jgi:competence protein ComEA
MKRPSIFGNLLIINKSERNGVLVLLAILIVIIVFRFFIPQLFRDETSYAEEIKQKIEWLEQQKQDEIDQWATDGSNAMLNARPNVLHPSQPSSAITYFNFDPNKVTRAELLQLGLSERGADIFLNFRSRGAVFNKPSDLLKVYSIDSALYLKLEPYISIQKTKNTKPEINNSSATNIPTKQEGAIEINRADSALWITLPGIGPVFAGRICRFRDKLGGFVNMEQLLEVYNFTNERYYGIVKQLTIDTTGIKKININFADTDQLRNHPYCNYSTARKIIEYRSHNGSFKTVEQLINDSLLTRDEFKRFSPYLTVR